MNKKGILKIVLWVLCAFFALGGIGMITKFRLISALFCLVLAFFLCPMASDILYKLTNKRMSRTLQTVMAVVMFIITPSIVGAGSKNDEPDQPVDSVQEITETAAETTTEPEETTTTVAETTTEVTTTTTVAETTTVEETTTEEITTTETVENVNFSTDSVCSMLKSTLKDNFDDADVYYDESSDCYFCTIYQPGLNAGCESVLMGISSRSEWDSVVNSMQSLGNTMLNTVEKLGTPSQVSLFVVDPLTPDNAMIWVLNGVVMTDAVKKASEQN